MFIILYSYRYWVHMCYISIDKFKLSFLKFPCFPRGEHSHITLSKNTVIIKPDLFGESIALNPKLVRRNEMKT